MPTQRGPLLEAGPRLEPELRSGTLIPASTTPILFLIQRVLVIQQDFQSATQQIAIRITKIRTANTSRQRSSLPKFSITRLLSKVWMHRPFKNTAATQQELQPESLILA